MSALQWISEHSPSIFGKKQVKNTFLHLDLTIISKKIVILHVIKHSNTTHKDDKSSSREGDQ